VPIRPNYVGKSIPSARADRVQVRLGPMGADTETRKSSDRVVLYTMVESTKESERPQ
jgi:pyrimidine operon attenuation protein/uracil phosphoribosyltransferase